jgi:hypothetical protein
MRGDDLGEELRILARKSLSDALFLIIVRHTDDN